MKALIVSMAIEVEGVKVFTGPVLFPLPNLMSKSTFESVASDEALQNWMRLAILKASQGAYIGPADAKEIRRRLEAKT